MLKAVLSKRLSDQISDAVQSIKSEISWDGGASLSQEDILTLFEENGRMNLEETIWENNHDYIWQQTWDDIYDIIKQFDQQIEKEIGDSYHEDDLRELVEDFRDDHPGVSVNLETLLSRMNNIPVRFPFYSNYDCINSHWLENDAGYWYENSYFGDCVDTLNINPHKLCLEMIDEDIHVLGEWPDLKERDGEEYVDIYEFVQELKERVCGANLLTILGTWSAEQIDPEQKKFLIPAGNPVGFFSSMQGGGSVFELELKKDFVIDIDQTFGTKYDHWGLKCDYESYSVTNVYGVTIGFFEAEIKPLPNE